MARLFLRDEERRAEVEGGVLTRRGPSLLAALSPLMSAALIGVLAVWTVALEVREGYALRDGEARDARVIARTHRTAGEKGYFVRYAYEAGGARYEREGRVLRQGWEAACEGCVIPIVSARGEPSLSRLPNETPLASAILHVCMALVFVPLIGAVGWFLSGSRLRARRLARGGALRFGSVVEGGADALCVRLDGADAALSAAWPDSGERPRPAPGTRVAVLYLDDTSFELL